MRKHALSVAIVALFVRPFFMVMLMFHGDVDDVQSGFNDAHGNPNDVHNDSDDFEQAACKTAQTCHRKLKNCALERPIIRGTLNKKRRSNKDRRLDQTPGMCV